METLETKPKTHRARNDRKQKKRLAYFAAGTPLKNKIRQIARHVKNFPNDLIGLKKARNLGIDV